jgi:hypothetical protein
MIQENVRQAGGSSRGESGQSIILLTFAFVALMLIVGLAIDLGMVYIERIRLSRACDAAALAAASELPFEDEAQLRAIEALAHNGYDVNSAMININGSYRSGPPSGASVTIDINTEDYQNAGAEDTADKIRVDGVSIVRMNIMQLIGIREAPVTWRAVAENVTNVDIALVLDRSGSMQEDTICFGCYEVGLPVIRSAVHWKPLSLRPSSMILLTVSTSDSSPSLATLTGRCSARIATRETVAGATAGHVDRPASTGAEPT